jgi:hypothetical protein
MSETDAMIVASAEAGTHARHDVPPTQDSNGV